ncbi:hypothetical protein AGMMS49992_28110 [Clostridia bacterium]|nr:hypothetical protein AGMMS49992_28110 [Clostridia bacterium]
MEIAYICSPYRGNVERNSQRARRFCLHALRNGYVPFAPHLHFPQFLNEADPAQRSLGLECGLTMLRKCDALFVYGEQVSSGMRREIDEAERLNVPVYYMPDDEGGSAQ